MDSQINQKLILVDRRHLELEGVRQVGSFDEREIVLETTMGVLFLKGEDLNIIKLNLDQGTISIQGFISSMEYKENKSARGKGIKLFSRIMK